MGYLPVTYNAEGGDHTLHLTCGTLEKDITLTVTRTMYDTQAVPVEEDVGGGEEFRIGMFPAGGHEPYAARLLAAARAGHQIFKSFAEDGAFAFLHSHSAS